MGVARGTACYTGVLADPMSSSSSLVSLSPGVRLALEPGLEPSAARALLGACGSAAAVYAASPTRLAAVVSTRVARQLAAPPSAELSAALGAVQAWAAEPDQHCLVWDDPDYPPLLRHLHDPPVLLYVVGQRAALSRAGLAIVGARQASAGGCETAAGFARHLAAAGWSVVSGLATGIDAAAHAGALAAGAQGGGTVAVLGTGADIIYPARHRALAADIVAAGGALVSELPLGAPPRPAHFPRRNRLVAGMTHGVLVVEAALQSGSLITARLAADLGREVFAIPGSLHAPLSRGCHALIRQGAKLTETVADMLEELEPGRWPAAGIARPGGPCVDVGGRDAPSLRGAVLPQDPLPVPSAGQAATVAPGAATRTTADERTFLDPTLRHVLDTLGFDPVLVDDVQRRTELPAATVQAALLRLELAGLVRRAPGGRFERAGG